MHFWLTVDYATFYYVTKHMADTIDFWRVILAIKKCPLCRTLPVLYYGTVERSILSIFIIAITNKSWHWVLYAIKNVCQKQLGRHNAYNAEHQIHASTMPLKSERKQSSYWLVNMKGIHCFWRLITVLGLITCCQLHTGVSTLIYCSLGSLLG